MIVLLIGGGAREHALAWKLAQSPKLTRLLLAPGNAGMASLGERVVLDAANHDAVIALCRARNVALVVVGPEGPLVAGLVDALQDAGIAAFGPRAAAARLEGSKAFTKALAAGAGVPTAAYAVFDAREAALAHLAGHSLPVVVKADGLAAGKGVTVAATLDEASAAIDACFAGHHGAAGSAVVIEECLAGEEVSFFALCDGVLAVPFGAAQDHKRAFDGDTGPNTGGMGAYAPTPVLSPLVEAEIMTRVIRPTLAAMAQAGTPFRGLLYAGLMLTATGPKLIEYNVRFGDPETQVLMVRLESDLLPLLLAAATGSLAHATVAWRDEVAIAVVMAANGYPGASTAGSAVGGLSNAREVPGVVLFHACTEAGPNDGVIAGGGRTLSVTASAATLAEARARAYAAVDAIDWPGGFARRDIGLRAIGPVAG